MRTITVHTRWVESVPPWDSLDDDGEEEEFEDTVCLIFIVDGKLIISSQVFD
jgi:hypothetical protein